MIQIVPRAINFISYTKPDTYWSIFTGGNATSDTFGTYAAAQPMPWAATLRNLVVITRDVIPQSLTVTLFQNGNPTALTVTLPAGTQGPVSITGIDVSFNQFDDIFYQTFTPSGVGFPGYSIGVCIEVESQGNIFGLTPTLSFEEGRGQRGGALGSGSPGSYTFPNTGLNSSYSINAVNGNLTTLVLKSYSGPINAGGGWTSFYVVDGIFQDGSPGTVDTRCFLTEGNITANSNFILPISLEQRVEVLVYRTGNAAPFALNVGIGVGFVPDNDGEFMLCGFDSNTKPMPTAYTWPYRNVPTDTEPIQLAPIGLSGLIATGLYLERSGVPGSNQTFTHIIRKNEVNTPIEVILSNFQSTGFINGLNIPYVNGDVISLRLDSTALQPQINWGLAARVASPAVPGTIIINKITSDGNTVTPFPINIGGGLSPSQIELTGGSSQIYENVQPGIYSVVEIPPSGWQVSYSVSNGDPNTALNLNEEETIIVNVTNTLISTSASGIYKLVPGKRNDTLWIDVDAGTTRDVKIPNPFIKTGLIGE